jgi:hypothetical protein
MIDGVSTGFSSSCKPHIQGGTQGGSDREGGEGRHRDNNYFSNPHDVSYVILGPCFIQLSVMHCPIRMWRQAELSTHEASAAIQG